LLQLERSTTFSGNSKDIVDDFCKCVNYVPIYGFAFLFELCWFRVTWWRTKLRSGVQANTLHICQNCNPDVLGYIRRCEMIGIYSSIVSPWLKIIFITLNWLIADMDLTDQQSMIVQKTKYYTMLWNCQRKIVSNLIWCSPSDIYK